MSDDFVCPAVEALAKIHALARKRDQWNLVNIIDKQVVQCSRLCSLFKDVAVHYDIFIQPKSKDTSNAKSANASSPSTSSL